jgi:hypothetical protein
MLKNIFFLQQNAFKKKTKPIIVIFNNYLMTLQPNLFPRIWHELIIYEPHSSSKWIVDEWFSNLKIHVMHPQTL